MNASITKKSVFSKKNTWNGLLMKTVTRYASLNRYVCVSAQTNGKMQLTASVKIFEIRKSVCKETERSGIGNMKSVRNYYSVRKNLALADHKCYQKMIVNANAEIMEYGI